jgi:hypothetical protein
MACQFEKQSIIDKCPTLMRILESELPDIKQDFNSVAVTAEGESCTGDIILDTNQPDAFESTSDVSSVMSDIAVADCEVTPAECNKLLKRLPLKLMPPHKSYRKDCIHHNKYGNVQSRYTGLRIDV